MTFFYIVVILLQAGVIVFFLRKKKKPMENEGRSENSNYEASRLQAIGVTPADLKLAIPEDRLLVYGVVMDWNTGGVCVTLAAFITGAAALYLSNGGGVESGGKDPCVGEAAVDFVVAAHEHLDSTVPTASFLLPGVGIVRFYLLTNKGVFAAQEPVKHFDNNMSSWTKIFQKGNEVITEMRMGSINN